MFISKNESVVKTVYNYLNYKSLVKSIKVRFGFEMYFLLVKFVF